MGAGVRLHHLELHRPHAAPDQEDVICRHTHENLQHTHWHTVRPYNDLCTFVYRPVRLQKIGLEKNLKEVPGQTLNGVVEGQDVDPFAVLDVGAGVNAVGKQTNKKLLVIYILFNRTTVLMQPIH